MSADTDTLGVGTGNGDGAKPKPKAPKLLTGQQIEKRLRELVDGAGELCEEVGDPYSGYVLKTRAEPLAGAYGRLAQRNDTWRRLLSSLLTTSELAEALIMTGATVVPILVHRGWLPNAGIAQIFMFGLTAPSDEVRGGPEGPRRAAAPAAGYPGAGGLSPDDQADAEEFIHSQAGESPAIAPEEPEGGNGPGAHD